MRIGILGSGDVAKALGTGFIRTGHEVMLGTRSVGKLKEWSGQTRGKVGSFEEAAGFSEAAVLATRWDGTQSALELAQAKKNLAGKVVIDVTNPLDFSKGVPPTLAVAGNDSGGEQVQRWLPESKVVKAWNIVGNAHMFRPDFPGGPPDMFIAGNDDGAKKTVTEILKSFGWSSVVDLGGIEASRYLEAMAMAWILYGFRTGTWNHAFKLLRK